MSVGIFLLLCAFSILISGVILLGQVICSKEKKPTERIDSLRKSALYCFDFGYSLFALGMVIIFVAHFFQS